MEQLLQVLRRTILFSGRAGLTEFWAIFILLMLVDAGLASVFGEDVVILPVWPGYHLKMIGGMGAAGLLITIGSYIPLIAPATRRLHDQDRSGWLQLVLLIPYVGIIAMIALMYAPGTPGRNRYGPDPRSQSPLAATG